MASDESPKTESRPDVELAKLRMQHSLEFQRVNNLTALGGTAIKWGALLVALYMMMPIFGVLVGNGEFANILSSVIGSDKFVEMLLAAWAALATGYGRLERKLSKDTVEKFEQFKRAAEQTVDPDRSSSELTRRGETRPEDSK